MGNTCCGEDSTPDGASKRRSPRRRFNDGDYIDTTPALRLPTSEGDNNKSSVNVHPTTEPDSLPPSPPRMQRRSSSSFEQSPNRAHRQPITPLDAPAGAGGSGSSPGDPMAAPTFLAHVNGSRSHPVGRLVFELWCVYLNDIDRDGGDERAALESSSSDAFRGGSGNNNNGGSNGHRRSTHIASTANFGDADVSQTATSTRVEKWATQHASEGVSHESVDELAQDFMRYLKEDIRGRGWGGEFDFDIQGFDATGVLRVTINLQRHSELEFTTNSFVIVCKYHSVSLL